MNTPDAQARIDQILAFKSELHRLETEQVLLLSASNKAAIDTYHQSLLQQFRAHASLDFSTSARSLSLGMRAFSLVATVALVAFVFLVVEDVWDLFASPGRIVLLLGLTFISLAIAALCRARDTYGYYVSIAAVVAAMAFAVNLLGLGKITGSGSTLAYCLAVAVYCWLLAHLFNTALLMWLAILHLVVVVALAGVGGFSRSFDDSWDTPEKILITPLLVFGLYALERRLGLYHNAERSLIMSAWIVFITAIALQLMPESSELPLDGTPIEWIYRVVAIATSSGLIFYALRRGSFAGVQHGLGLFMIYIWIEFIQHFWDVLPTHLVFLVLGVFAIGCVWLLRRMHKRDFAITRGPRGV